MTAVRLSLCLASLMLLTALAPVAMAQGQPQLVIEPRFVEPGRTGSITLPEDLRDSVPTKTVVYIRTPGAFACASGARYSITIDVQADWPKWAGASMQPLDATVIDYQIPQNGGATSASPRHNEVEFDTATLGFAWDEDAPDNGTHRYTLIVKEVRQHPQQQGDCAPASPLNDRDEGFDTLNVTKPWFPPDPEAEGEDCTVDPSQPKCAPPDIATPESPGIGPAALIVALAAIASIVRRRRQD